MKHTGSGIAVSIAALAIFLSASSPLFAQDVLGELFAPDPVPVKNCTFCHGTSGQGYSTAPRLAGQRAQYIEKQLGGFARHIRDNPYSAKFMWNAVANLTPETGRNLAAYFAAQPPRPADDGRPDLVAAGKAIYENGVAESDIVACVACHGPNAEGIREIPRLGGLSYLYLKRRLEQWSEGYHAAGKPMPQIARTLSADEIEALASYLSFVD